MSTPLSQLKIRQYLTTESLGQSLFLYPVTDSTNLRAKLAAEEGASSGLCIIAEEQTAGRGRLGRSFLSPAQNGIYMSILLRPEAEIEQTVLITAATAVCVARAIEQVAECRVSIKWVNDLFIRQKKVCGILTEAAVLPNSKKLSYAIVGIGINLSDDGIPEEIREIAGGIVPTGAPRPSRERLIAEILNQLEALLSDFRPERFLSEYRDRSNLIGKSVSIIQNNIPIESGVAVDIDDDARLVVRLDSGELKHLSSGEISCRTE